MTHERFKALLIDDNPEDARLVQEMLAEGGFARFDLEVSDRLAGGMRRLSEGDVDVVLVDLGLPDSQGVNTIALLHAHAPDVPIVVLTGTSDEATGIQALSAGAQEYLLKDQASGVVLVRALRYAIERKRLDHALQRMAVVDDLTGVYNRRGFFQRAPRRLAVAHRDQKRAVLALVDMDGLKQINDTYGHLEGDNALVSVAAILRQTFREDDIIARIGGDEFAVLAIVKGSTAEQGILDRLQRNLVASGTAAGYTLSVSLGLAALEVGEADDFDGLLKRADRCLYERKRSKGRTGQATPKAPLQERSAP
jgi:two-component system, cell cycle response regulator